jgi:hypothetical protein
MERNNSFVYEADNITERRAPVIPVAEAHLSSSGGGEGEGTDTEGLLLQHNNNLSEASVVTPRHFRH